MSRHAVVVRSTDRLDSRVMPVRSGELAIRCQQRCLKRLASPMYTGSYAVSASHRLQTRYRRWVWVYGTKGQIG